MKLLLLDNYLAAIANSVGSKAYQSIFAMVDGRRRDLTQRGTLSCAYFVTAILKLSGLLRSIHLTVDGTVKEMRTQGWKKVRGKKLRPGTVLVWGAEQFSDGPHKHIGFFVGNGRAVSTSYRSRTVRRHHWTYNGKRPVTAAYWHPKLGK